MVAVPRDLYPFQSHYLERPDGRYHYVDEGPRDAPPVVMLHGNPTWSFYYRRLIQGLKNNYRVIVPDHMGCGLSDRPTTPGYTLAQHITNVEALVDHLGLDRFDLVVHDWGGVIGSGYATRHPERVQHWVIFNTGAFYLPAIPKRIRLCRWPLLGELAVLGANAFLRLSFSMGTCKPERFSPEVRQGYLAPYHDWHSRRAILDFVRDIPLEDNHPSRSTLGEIEAKLPRLQNHPILIIWGKHDVCFTEQFLARWQTIFPHAQVQLLEDAGHYVVEDAHERILPWLADFLADRPLTV